jgi:stage II sporulation protein D
MRWRPSVAWGSLALLLCAGAVAAPAAPPHEEPVLYVALGEEVAQVRLRSPGGFFVGRWGSRRRPTWVAPGETWTFRAEGDGIRVRDGHGGDRGLVRGRLFAFPRDPEQFVELDGARYRGEFLLVPRGPHGFAVLNAVRLEDYLKGVLPAEIGRLGPEAFEALKAQAVAARSYTIYQMREHADDPYDVLPTEADQVYLGVDGEDALANRAVEATWGIVALYRGEVIRANYSSTCGGRTASAKAVWPDGPDLPYLRARRDTGPDGQAFCARAPFYRWKEEWPCRAFYETVRRNLWRAIPELEGKDPGVVRDLKILRRTPSGRVGVLEVRTERGRYEIRGDALRWVFRRRNGGPLRSILLGRMRRERRGGRCLLVLEGGGFGHGVGMCQTGAIAMARAGYTYVQILRHYYYGIRIAQIYDSRRGLKPPR